MGGALGGLTGGLFGFGGSAISQLLSGEKFSYRKAWGAAANGAVAGAAKGAVISSGVGLPLAALADFAAGTAGSALEQWISEGEASARKSITSGLTNAVSGAIYGNIPLKSFKQALGKGAASGAATSGIDYLSSLFEPQADARRSLGIEYQGGADGLLIPRDPKRGCGTPDPTIGSLNYGKDYGYQYHVPSAEETTHRGRRFSLTDFIKETMTGAVTGGLASATFYGAGKAVEALKESIGNVFENVNDKVVISASGNPQDILFEGADLNKRQQELLLQLQNFGDSTVVGKNSVSLKDISALTSYTGNEFALFTNSGRRMIIRGNSVSVPVNVEIAQNFAGQGWRWSGHSHPGITRTVLAPSENDRIILQQFKNQTYSTTINSVGSVQRQCHLLNENSDITSEFFFSTSNPNFFNYYLTNTSSCAAFF